MSKTYCLNWNNFQSKVSSSLQTIRNEGHFSDVTLVSDDHVSFSVHKIVLSTSSNFFKQIFVNNPHQNSLLYIHGIDSQMMKLIIDFIYEGQVQLKHDILDHFLTDAQKLKLEGLLPASHEGSSKTLEDIIKVPKVEMSDNPVFDDNPEMQKENENTREEFISLPTINTVKNNASKVQVLLSNTMKNSVGKFINSTKRNKARNIALKASSNMSSSEMNEIISQKARDIFYSKNGRYKCRECSKVIKSQPNIYKHAELHVEGLKYDCQHCSKTFKTKNSLYVHKSQCCK